MSKHTSTCTPVGIAEIAKRLNVAPRTPSQWRFRGLLPKERWTVGGDPAWCWEHDIQPWVEKERSRRFPASRPAASDKDARGRTINTALVQASHAHGG
jgi:hypothetical protein